MVRNEKKDFSQSLSVMRISAAAAVILLHTCSTLSENRDIFAMSDSQAVFFTAVSDLMRWAVPVFFMITGALLLDPEREITYRKNVFRYVRRIVLALLVFGIPFALLKLIMENHGFTPAMVWKAVLCIAENQSLSHLWYLYDLIGIYLILPLIRPFIIQNHETEEKDVLLILFSFCCAVPALSLLTGLNISFRLPVLYPLFYLLAGKYLYVHHEKYKKPVLVLITAISAVIITALTLISRLGWLASAYESPLIAVFSLSIYCLFLQHRYKESNSRKTVIWSLDRLCFAVYLIHPVFIQFTYRFLRITPLVFENIWPVMTVIFWSVFICLSFGGAWILRNIPLMRKYIL